MRLASLFTRFIPQSERLDPRQVENNAGGFVFALDRWARLDRFLVLGSDAPTYYQKAVALTRENAAVVLDCLADDPARTIARVAEVSESGRAPKNDPAIFALALAAVSPDAAARKLAFAAMPRVCRTGTHLFQFVDTAQRLGKGWGRGMKRAVARWYDEKPVADVAFQAIKYRSRERLTHARLLKTAHPGAGHTGDERGRLYRWIVGKEADGLPPVVAAHRAAMKAERTADLLPLVRDHRLSWEALPTWANADPAVWEAMLPHLGLTALVRNLGNMTRIGAIVPLSDAERTVVARLADTAAIRKARVHPFAILQALAVYRSGKGVRGSGTWEPSGPVLAALDGAFHKAFANVEPAGKRLLVGLDVSGSMGSPMMGSSLTVRDAAAAMALVTVATEPRVHVLAFTNAGRPGHREGTGMTPLPITAGQRLDDVVRLTSGLPFGGTDCALPMLHALEKRIAVDAFVIYTDNETWAGDVHPAEALRRYRTRMRIPAKLVVVGMTSTGFSIADPADGGMLDVVGFDAAAPALVADFIRA